VTNKKSVSFAKLTRLLTAQPKDKSTNLRPIGPQSSNDTVTDISCFFWNSKGINGKLKKSGSVDSLMDAQQTNKNNISITSIAPELVANETENTFIKRDRNIPHRFKSHLPISSTSSVQLFEAQRNIQDMAPSSPSAPYRLTKTLPVMSPKKHSLSLKKLSHQCLEREHYRQSLRLH
jgi:hypothetical protein